MRNESGNGNGNAHEASDASSDKNPSRLDESRWPHRWALSVTLAIFPLIWVGGLVTTQDAGMAVPDWPNTYGYNMFAYPLSTWIYGPFDLLVEHGHRLLGSFVGLLAIGLCIVVWTEELRVWVRWMCVLLLIAVILQGLLGGFRVLLDARTLAMIHGCFAAIVFGFATSVVVVTSQWWKTAALTTSSRLFRWLSIGLTISTVVQLILGAQLRHVQPWTTPSAFTGLVHLHLTFAAIVTLLVFGVTMASFGRSNRQLSGIGWPTLSLLVLLLVQIGLGMGTWIANYALPWIDTHPYLARYTIATKGQWESWIITGHQATGSLIIASALILALRVWRQSRQPTEINFRELKPKNNESSRTDNSI